MIIKIPVTPGELVDKITILELKASKVKDSANVLIIVRELNTLLKIYESMIKRHSAKKSEINKLKTGLSNVNEKLWLIEDKIRRHESEKDFDVTFIELARSVYMNNDKRSSFKNKINKLFGSGVKEVKEYYQYEK
jgi:hypothetical protein